MFDKKINLALCVTKIDKEAIYKFQFAFLF